MNQSIIQHHGILGMHWGIRRFQPYPKGYKGNGIYRGEDSKVRTNTKNKIYNIMGKSYNKKINRRNQKELKYLNKINQHINKIKKKTKTEQEGRDELIKLLPRLPESLYGLHNTTRGKAKILVKEGNAKAISKYRRYMTSTELKYAYNRLNFDKKIADMKPSKRRSAINYLNKQVDDLKITVFKEEKDIKRAIKIYEDVLDKYNKK